MKKVLSSGKITFIDENWSEINKTIYHYTTLEVLLKIIDEKELLATSVHYKNDKDEFTHIFKIAQKYIKERDVSEEYYKYYIDNIKEKTSKLKNNYFSISLSEGKDSHYMWEAYSRKNGVAIGFTIRKLIEIANSCNFSLEKCIYDTSKKDEQVIFEVNKYLTEKDTIEQKFDNMVYNLARKALYFKNKEYELEDEWRLISLNRSPFDDEIKFMFKNGLIIPYMKVKIEDSSINKILVGPSSNQDEIIESLMFFIIKNMKSNILIEKTSSTLRSYN